ncbi:MAG: NAD(P)/FAD-dependent oxidoreductase [Trebonia sp.]
MAGGGPGGSATAGLLALKGYSVLLLERDKFPRYHIGESVVTGIIPTLKELGIYERVDEAGFVRKYGGTLLWGKDQGVWEIGSDRAVRITDSGREGILKTFGNKITRSRDSGRATSRLGWVA